MIELNCITCGHHLRIDDKYAGHEGKCRNCGGSIHVPLKQVTAPPPLQGFYGEQSNSGPATTEQDRTRKVGRYQRLLILFVLANVICYAGIVFTIAIPVLCALFFLAGIAFIPFMIYALWGLGKALGKSTGVLVFLCMLLPFFGIIVLLILNAEATRFLKDRNIAVGFLGARSRDLPPPSSGNAPATRGATTSPRKNSGLGIASFIVAIISAISVVLVLMIAGIMDANTPGSLDEDSPATVILGLLLLLIGPAAFVAFILGVIGCFQKEKARLFAALGTAFSAATLVLFALLFVFGGS